MRPTPIIREEKEQGMPSDLPIQQKYTYQNANEDKNKINAAIDFLPIQLISGDDGILTGYTYTQTDGETVNIVNILSGKHIGAIIQLGSGVTFAEYNPELTEGADMFSKDLDEIQIMQAATHDPMIFSPKTAYLLFPR